MEKVIKLGGNIPIELSIKIFDLITSEYPNSVIKNGENGFFEITLKE